MMGEVEATLAFVGGLLAFIGAIISFYDHRLAKAKSEHEEEQIKLKYLAWLELMLWLLASILIYIMNTPFSAIFAALPAYLIHIYFYLTHRVRGHRPATFMFTVATFAIFLYINMAFISLLSGGVKQLVENQSALISVQKKIISEQKKVLNDQKNLSEQLYKTVQNQSKIVNLLENNNDYNLKYKKPKEERKGGKKGGVIKPG